MDRRLSSDYFYRNMYLILNITDNIQDKFCVIFT